MCSIFVCSNSGMADSVQGLLTCAQMLMHAIAHGGRTDTVSESALSVLRLTFQSGALPPELFRCLVIHPSCALL